MRKYYQAALALTAAVSLISLLFYRHEYNKLRYVLEVFSYFGKPYQKDGEANCTNVTPMLTKFNMKFEEPYSSWQRLDNDLYLYSAYSIKEKEVQVIGFGSLNNIKDIQCVLFFESEIKPILGTFKYTLINHNSNAINIENDVNYIGYRFLCEHKKNEVPIGISFLTKSNANLHDAPMLSVKNQLSVSLNHSSIGVCVIPPLVKQMPLLDMISFINFHDIIGMNNFIIYDFGVPTKLNSYLKEMSTAQTPFWKFTYAIIPWNFPFSGIDRSIIKDIIQTDCLYRTYNKAMYVITLSWEEYVVLKYHHSVADLLTDYRRSKLIADGYKLKSLTFCMQQVKNTAVGNFTPTIFKVTHYDPSIAETDSIQIQTPHHVLMKTNNYIQVIGKDLAVLNRYKHCIKQSNPKTELNDSSILRFTDDMQNSAFFKKVMIDKVFVPRRQ